MGLFSKLLPSLIGGIGGGISSRSQQKRSIQGQLKAVEMQNKGALERQNDQQEFEQFLMDRRTVAGDAAFGGRAQPPPNFWFGASDVDTDNQVKEFFSGLNSSRKTQFKSPPRARPSISAFSEQVRIDPNETVQGLEARETYRDPLGLLNRHLARRGDR